MGPPLTLRLSVGRLVRIFLLTVSLVAVGTACAQEPTEALPSFAQMEAAGARIGEVRVSPNDIFDTADPKENNWLFRTANKLHILTRPSVIERALLFKSGDALSVRLLEETERLLRSNRYLYDVHFRPLAYRDGVVDIEVLTRDTWSLDPGFSAGRTGGTNSSSLRLREYNVLGTGTSISIGRSKTVDRKSTEFQFSNTRAFGTWASVSYEHASNSDGKSNAASVVRPFYALDTRWAAGVSASKDKRIDAVYNAGEVASQYRRRETKGEVFAGWSPGLQDGWVQRYSLGASLQDDTYAPQPGLLAPAALPADEKLVAPFVRYELIEDRFERELNRNLIGRPEFFALGLASTLQLGRAATGLGSSRNAWLYSASVSRGFEPFADHTLVAAAKITGQYGDAQVAVLCRGLGR
jgi:hypothetical protein